MAARHAGLEDVSVVADLREAAPEDGPARGIWDYAAVDDADSRLLVARMTGVEVVVLAHPQLGRMLASGQHVHTALPLPGGQLVFTNGDTDTLAMADIHSGALVATVPTGRKPDGAIYDAAAGQVLVMNGGDGTATRVDVRAATPRVVGSIAVGGKLEAAALGTGDRLFVNVEDRNSLAIVSLGGAGRLLRDVSLPGCEAPSGLAFDKASRLLVSACENGVALVLDEEGRVRATLPIGPHPDAAIGDAAHQRVFVPSGGNGTLSEILLDGVPRVRRVWHTRPGARTGAYDPDEQRLYLPYGSVIHREGQPPRLVPGTFGILVLDVR